ncbi:uncharacterized protein LOC134210280 [Armigeres subalbatus]|uniref:uncharacterized protein LOC134210280 n=1 Tax=Armigeres subalbatus TaxID=124917 RepID=UPI002ED4D052
MEQELEAEMTLKKKEREIKRAIERKRLMLEKKMYEEEEEQEKLLQEEILRERKAQVDRMRTNKQSFEENLRILDEQMRGLKYRTEQNKLKKDVDAGEGVSGVRTPLRNPEVGKVAEQATIKRKSTPIVPSQDVSDSDDETDADETAEEDPTTYSEESDGSIEETERKLTKISKRKSSQYGSGISRKLPTFSGKPEEWPLFYGTYQASNEACGYSDVENLVRLQECLKGPALEMVRGQLLLPKSVPKVIAKLRQLYGRPEQLLQSHLDKVRRLESPKTGKLASFIPFGTAVEQLCEHLEAAELKQHLVNPLLVQDLVDKLPDNEKREWVRFKRGKKRVTLRTFTDFLSEIVAEVCEANVSLECKSSSKPISGGRSGMGNGSKGALFNHDEGEQRVNSPELVREERKGLKPCRVCNRTDHRLRYCQDFKSLDYAERMQVVNQWKLCRVCLNEHGQALCKFKLRCNVGDCRQAHNPLLHPVDGVIGTSAHIRTNNMTMFRMIPVRLHSGQKSITVLAFLDEGASVTLVERRIADRLGVVGVQEKLPSSGQQK